MNIKSSYKSYLFIVTILSLCIGATWLVVIFAKSAISNYHNTQIALNKPLQESKLDMLRKELHKAEPIMEEFKTMAVHSGEVPSFLNSIESLSNNNVQIQVKSLNVSNNDTVIKITVLLRGDLQYTLQMVPEIIPSNKIFYISSATSGEDDESGFMLVNIVLPFVKD